MIGEMTGVATIETKAYPYHLLSPEHVDKFELSLQALLKHVEDMLRHSTPLEFKPGQTLFYQGHNPSGVYVVLSGEVELSRTDETGERSLERLPVFSIFGIDLLLADEAYPFTATAKTTSQVSFIPKDRVIK